MDIHVAKDADPEKTEVCLESLRRLGVSACADVYPEERFDLVGRRRFGRTMYCDGDFVFLKDPRCLAGMVPGDMALGCVQHPMYEAPPLKKGGQTNEWYERKNWSSLMVINNAHYANRVQMRHARRFGFGLWEYHRFCWLADRHLGCIPPEWNVLVGIDACPHPAALHFTHGKPGESHAPRTAYDHHYLHLVRAVQAA